MASGDDPKRRLAEKFSDHFSARDAEREAGGAPVDPAELWGRRVGRVLGAIAFLGLVGWLVYQLTAG